MKNILVIDTQAGNLFSINAALTRLGFNVTILQQPNQQQFDGIVIPGQGRFSAVMKNIKANGWDVYLNQQRAKQTPILGICIGMQIMFESSREDPGIKGLGWFQGEVAKLNFPKLPMVGWAQLDSEVLNNSDVYFVNSFAIKQSDFSIATVNYGETFCAAIKDNNVIGVQFHPEKSAEIGSQIMLQALTLDGDKND